MSESSFEPSVSPAVDPEETIEDSDSSLKPNIISVTVAVGSTALLAMTLCLGDMFATGLHFALASSQLESLLKSGAPVEALAHAPALRPVASPQFGESLILLQAIDARDIRSAKHSISQARFPQIILVKDLMANLNQAQQDAELLEGHIEKRQEQREKLYALQRDYLALSNRVSERMGLPSRELLPGAMHVYYNLPQAPLQTYSKGFLKDLPLVPEIPSSVEDRKQLLSLLKSRSDSAKSPLTSIFGERSKRQMRKIRKEAKVVTKLHTAALEHFQELDAAVMDNHSAYENELLLASKNAREILVRTTKPSVSPAILAAYSEMRNVAKRFGWNVPELEAELKT